MSVSLVKSGITNGTRVTVNAKGGSEHEGRTGKVVRGSYWRSLSNNGSYVGSTDRVVKMDDTGERVVFESWMLTPFVNLRKDAVKVWVSQWMGNLTREGRNSYLGRVELNPFPAPAMIGQPTSPLVRV